MAIAVLADADARLGLREALERLAQSLGHERSELSDEREALITVPARRLGAAASIEVGPGDLVADMNAELKTNRCN